MSIAFLIVGLLLGAGAVYLWARTRLGAEHAAAAAERRSADEKLALLERSEDEWAQRIKAVTGDAMTTSQRSLLELADARLKPIRETLDKFERQAKELEDRRLKEVSAVGRQLQDVVAAQERLRAETGNLVTALREPQVRGRWGEKQLRNTVEAAGMSRYCDFTEQVSVTTDDGRRRPDMIVRLPGGRQIVVDSKVSLKALLDADAATDPAERERCLDDYVRHIREQIKQLSLKAYWQQFDPSPDFVILFLPGEGFFRMALERDPSLLEFSSDQRVHLASPMSLITMLHAVAVGWREAEVSENARKIEVLGRELYERLGVFSRHFAKAGRSLGNAVDAYNDAVSSFDKRLMVTARKFPEVGVSDEAPPELAQIEVTPTSISAPELVALPAPESDAA